MTHLYHNGRWVTRTTPNGVEFNGKVPLWRKVYAYALYIKLKVCDWFDDCPPPSGYT